MTLLTFRLGIALIHLEAQMVFYLFSSGLLSPDDPCSSRESRLLAFADVLTGTLCEMCVTSAPWRPPSVQRHLRQQALLRLDSCEVRENAFVSNIVAF